MADAIVNVELAPELGLPYAAGAETALPPAEAALFDTVSAIAGVPLTLIPGLAVPLDELADFLAAARQGGAEPPDLFAWYSLACPEEAAAAVAAALAALPFVVQAAIRPAIALAAWEVVPDPDTAFQRYHRMPPAGINSYAAWQVPGGSGRGTRVADVEHGWDLDHPELQSADVTRLNVLPPVRRADHDHGTQALGIVGAHQNGGTLTGIAPAARLAVAHAGGDAATAIVLAARHVGRGGIVLIEIGEAIPERIAEDTGHIPLEHDPMIKAVIVAATALGVLIVEPAGNGSVNLDTDPRYPDLRPPAANSGALIVAAGQSQTDESGSPTYVWMPAVFTTGGSRVNCFAPGLNVPAPISGGLHGRADFSGTSAASAIIAGVAAVVQGVATASRHGMPLSSAELHARLSDPKYGAPPEGVMPENPQAIGVMPDLEKLIEGLGVARIPPVSTLRTSGDRVAVMRAMRGDVRQIEMLEGSGAPGAWVRTFTTGTPKHSAVGVGHAVGLHASTQAGVLHIDAVTTSEWSGVLHRPFVPDVGLGLDAPWRPVTVPTDEAEAFRLSAPMTGVASGDRLLVAGLGVNGLALVVVAERKAGSREVVPTSNISLEQTDHEPAFVRPDPVARFDYPPVIFDHGGSVILVGVDRDGWIRVAHWTPEFGWTLFEFVAHGLDPNQPPAIASDGAALHVVGFDPTSRELREVVRSPNAEALFEWTALRAIAQPPPVTWGLPLEPATAVAMAGDGAGALMAVALTIEGRPIFTVRLPGLDWTPLLFMPALSTFALRGGVVVASPRAGEFVAAASDDSGALYTAAWNLLGWTPFVAV